MYAMVAFFTVCGLLALDRSLRTPRAGNLVAVGAGHGAAALQPLLGQLPDRGRGPVAGLPVVAGPGVASPRGPGLVGGRGGGVRGLPALGAHLPLPVQAHGDPLGHAGQLLGRGQRRLDLRRGRSSQGRALGLLFFAAAGSGCAGWPSTASPSTWTCAPVPVGRPFAWVFVGTMAAAIVGGYVSRSAFDARYASVVFIPLVILVGLGFTVIGDKWVRVGLVAVAVVLGLAGRSPTSPPTGPRPDRWRRRLARHGSPGDVVVYCPDQLGPRRRPPAPGRPVPADHLPPGDVARVRELGRLRGGHRRGAARDVHPARRELGRNPPHLRGLGRRVPGVRAAVRGDRADTPVRPPLPGDGLVTAEPGVLLPTDERDHVRARGRLSRARSRPEGSTGWRGSGPDGLDARPRWGWRAGRRRPAPGRTATAGCR